LAEPQAAEGFVHLGQGPQQIVAVDQDGHGPMIPPPGALVTWIPPAG
jgi:hypothetical protein